MKELIYKADARRAVLGESPATVHCIDKIKPVDAVIVIHSAWEDNELDPRHICINCARWLLVETATAEMNFCPNCGAKMDGGKLK